MKIFGRKNVKLRSDIKNENINTQKQIFKDHRKCEYESKVRKLQEKKNIGQKKRKSEEEWRNQREKKNEREKQSKTNI